MAALKVKITSNFEVSDDVLQLVEETIGKGCKEFAVLSDGQLIENDQRLKVSLGPVVGEVTATSAVVVLEVECRDKNEFKEVVSCQLYKKDDKSEVLDVQEIEMTSKRPFAFVFDGLEAETPYEAVFLPIASVATFKTKRQNVESFRLIALSCDKPSRLLMGQINPWKFVAKAVESERGVDAILHIGDQIYPDNENMKHADKIFMEKFDSMSQEKQEDMMNRGKELWRQKYRQDFNQIYKRRVLSQASNLMIWSDNDVANDFTTLKNDSGEPAYHPKFLMCGMETYRDYQRRLWDPNCGSK